MAALVGAVGWASAQEAPADWSRLASGRGIWRGVSVEYKIANGWAMVEGDILLGRVEELQNEGTPKQQRREASIVAGDRYHWTDGTVFYTIDPKLPEPDRVREAIEYWQSATPLKFVERASEPNYVTFQPTASGCNSYIGMRGGQQFVNLSYGCSTGSIVHEIGHTVGLFHTQARADRDRYVRVLYENLDKLEWSQYKQHITDGEEAGPYDYASIMHYPDASFSRNYLATMATIPAGIPIGQRTEFSAGDLYAVLRVYGKPVDGFTVTTSPPGLTITVDGVSYTAPRQFSWAPGEEHTIAVKPRQALDDQPNSVYAFAHWSDERPIEHVITVNPDERIYDARFIQRVRVRAEAVPPEAGRVEIVPASADGFYARGSRIQVRAVPKDGYRFFHWWPGRGGVTVQGANGLGVSANPATVRATRDNLYYSATFTSAPVTTVTSTPPGCMVIVDGFLARTPASYTWTPGSSHTLNVPAWQSGVNTSTRYQFVRWLHDGPAAQTITAAPESTTLTAEFRAQFQVAVRADWAILAGSPSHPTLENILLNPAAPEDSFFDQGSAIEFSATSGETWQFANWTGDLAGSDFPKSLLVNDQTVVTANFLSPPFVNTSAVVNDATMQPGPISPGQVLTVFRPALGPDEPVDGAPNEDGSLPSELAGVWVLFDGEPAKLVRVGANYMRLIVPLSVAGRRSTGIQVRAGNLRAAPYSIAVRDQAPGVYTLDGSGTGQVRGANEDGSANSSDAPAAPGAKVSVLATGLGGIDASTLPRITARIGETDAGVLAVEPAEGQPPGIFRITVRIPGDAPGGAMPLYVASDFRESQPGVTVAVRVR